MRAEPGAVVPLNLTVNKEGGVTGLSPTVAVRRGTSYWLDWADSTFKTGGWTTRKQVMTEIGGGHYVQSLDFSTVPVIPGETLVVEYDTESVDYPGVVSEALTVDRDTDFLRKLATNRLEQSSGAPGHLVLYDDDGVSPLKDWAVTDEAGGGIAALTGVPAHRGAAT
jgi:hypothetical protein